MSRGLFVAATGKNVGKTTTCLGLISGLLKRGSSIGYMKPVGQEQAEAEEGVWVDKDVLLFKGQFSLSDPYEAMSPVLFPRGFTRDFLDGKIERSSLTDKIQSSFQTIIKNHPLTIVEGTGHMGVGSIIDLNNAQVASLLKTPLILIASGGLGSSFDELSLNYTQCEKYGVEVAGVLLNRVLDEKREMIIHYMSSALKRLNVPLLGSIPYTPFLSYPSMADFELLFNTELISGQTYRLRHFEDIRLVATSLEMYRTLFSPNQLIITPAGREDIILAALTQYWDLKIANRGEYLEIGMILTGKEPPKEALVEQLKKAEIPMIYAPVSSFVAMKMVNTFTTKIRQEDKAKIDEAIQTVESHIDFEQLTHRIGLL